MNKNVRQFVIRFMFYLLGMLCLALGISLNTKTGLGVSPIISVPYSISQITGLDFGNMTFVVYTIFVVTEFILRRKRSKWYDALQIIVALVFTRFLNLFLSLMTFEFDSLWINLALLVPAIVLTGIGAAVTVNMKLIPNPGDGIVQAISETIHKGMGFTKNCFDFGNICLTVTISLVFLHHLVGIGIGTVLAVVGVGRCIWLFNKLFKSRMAAMCGLSENNTSEKQPAL